MSIEILAKLSRFIYQADVGNFAIVEFIDVATARRFKAKGTLAFSPKTDAKQTYRLIGEWDVQPKYGETFRTLYVEALRPQEIKGIAPYLAHNIKGVGEITAKKLLEHLNVKNIDELVEICRSKQEEIFNFFGEKKKHIAQNIIEILVSNEIFRSVMIFLHENEISANFAKKIYDKYGAQSIEILTSNPYRLISDFRQVGFLKADAIAQKLGISKTSPFRIEAAIIYSLEQAMDDGHCALPRDTLIENVAIHLGAKQDPQFSKNFVLDEMRKIYKKNKDANKESFLIRQLSLLQKNPQGAEQILFYLPEVLHMEDDVSAQLNTLIKIKHLNVSSEFEKKIHSEMLEKNQTFETFFPDIAWTQLSTEQQQAVKLSFDSAVMILTGGPGCGKTFVLKSIFKLQKTLQRKIALCAPTGLAAKRMSNSIGVTAFTIHKLLGLGIKKDKSVEHTIETIDDVYVDDKTLAKVDTIIIDESSMLNLEIFHALLKAGFNKRFIFVGDVDQLPSVGAGNCLKDMIESKKIPTATLTRIFRQTSESPIPFAAREIISGHKPEIKNIRTLEQFVQKEDLAFIPCSTDTFFDLFIPFVTTTIKTIYGLDPIKDCQILVPMRKTTVGQENINKILQEHLNPPAADKMEIRHPFGYIIRVNDKLIQTKNNYELDVFNGDLGYCRAIRKTGEGMDAEIEIDVEFPHKRVTYTDDQIEHLQLCYAMTVHKSQGSEFPLCIIPIFGCYYTMLDRNLLYTAVTRSSKHVILFGEEWALKKAIKTQHANNRYTALAKLIQ